MKNLRAGIYTVCLDTQKASADTYMNWVTFRLTRAEKGLYRLTRLSNANGNGQVWSGLGWVANGTIQAGWVEDCVSIACLGLLAAHFGLKWSGTVKGIRFPKARIWGGNATRVLDAAGTQMGRKTAAPTLLSKGRDKNVKVRRWESSIMATRWEGIL